MRECSYQDIGLVLLHNATDLLYVCDSISGGWPRIRTRGSLTIGVTGMVNGVLVLNVLNDTADESSSPVRGRVDGNKLVGTNGGHCVRFRVQDKKTEGYCTGLIFKMSVQEDTSCVYESNAIYTLPAALPPLVRDGLGFRC